MDKKHPERFKKTFEVFFYFIKDDDLQGLHL